MGLRRPRFLGRGAARAAPAPWLGAAPLVRLFAGYLAQGELYRLGALTTAFRLLAFLVLGTPWLLLAVH
jgi:hypothetical protein